MKKNKLRRTGVAAAAMAAVIAAGSAIGVSAYFTDTDNAKNTFTVGKVDIEQHEDNWNPDPENITPNQEFDKDPTVKNSGDNAAFVFEVVEVPCRTVITATADGTKNNGGKAVLTDLFSYDVSSEWALIKTENVNEGSNIAAHRYTYVYGTAEECTALEGGETTTPLFTKVRFANVIEGQGLEDEKVSIDINAYAIQTSDLGTTQPSKVLSVIYNQGK